MLMRDLDPRLKGMIIRAIRQWFTTTEKYKQVKMLSRVESPRYKKDGTLSKVKNVQYKCSKCKLLFKDSEVHIDHLRPVTNIAGATSEMTLRAYVKAIDCPLSNLQVLCVTCHKEKTKIENKSRVRTNKNTNRHTGNALKIKKKPIKKPKKIKL